MRTSKEIAKYLQSQSWYEDYRRNISQECDFEIVLDYINGSEYRDTIESAFRWKDTKQGVRYWSRVNKKFLKWYDNKPTLSDRIFNFIKRKKYYE